MCAEAALKLLCTRDLSTGPGLQQSKKLGPSNAATAAADTKPPSSQSSFALTKPGRLQRGLSLPGSGQEKMMAVHSPVACQPGCVGRSQQNGSGTSCWGCC